ncbi:hypothetical protein ATCC90586_008541 [Pythium insidiosum]|nr:hypothetical protein ATCC90586_008541 [Pythium insidiosum]
MALASPDGSDTASASSISHGERWATAFGLSEPTRRAEMRERYAFLSQHLVFRMDAEDIQDPLSAFVAAQEASAAKDAQMRSILDDDSDVEGDAGGAPATPEAAAQPRSSWSQYFSEETLLQDINTDLDRLYPAGNEGFFQNDRYLGVLRQVLFVWCKLHPDVSYRQGMHDVAAVVFYAFLQDRTRRPAPPEEEQTAISRGLSEGNLFGEKERAPPSKDESIPELPDHIEADTFLVFEAIMLYLKPFYEIVKSTFQQTKKSKNNSDPADERLFSSFDPSENDDPNCLFGGPPRSKSASSNAVSPSDGAAKKRPEKPALHQLCHHVQYDLLEQKDPQLFYHLQNLEIVPETYCLRWIRLLFAREFVFEALLHIWDGLIVDTTRPSVVYPRVRTIQEWQTTVPHLSVTEHDVDVKCDSSWLGFPLLRYICVAKLLLLAPELRQSDNTGCLRLLMRSFNAEEDALSVSQHEAAAKDVVRFAQVLRDPTLQQRSSEDAAHDGDGVDVVQFGPGSLGIVLTAAKPPFESRLAVKDFAVDPSTPDGRGQAEVSGQVRVGDLVEAINGVPIVGATTEEVKRHIQLISRPLFIAFRHCSACVESVPISILSPRAAGNVKSDDAVAPLPDSASHPDALVSIVLPGEMCYANVDTSLQKYTLSHDGSCVTHTVPGKFFVTNYRCLFTRQSSPSEIDWQVPVLSIASIDATDVGFAMAPSSALDHAQAVLGFSTDDTFNVVIRCKDTQVARLSFSNYAEYSKLVKCLTCLAFPASLLDAFCFAYAPTIAPSEEVPFDLRREYQRLGLLDCPDRLRCIDQSPRYELCETYPQHLIVPAEISDVRLKAAAAFRSHNRVPVVSWLHRQNGATICRSSQPLVGLKSNRSPEDEQLVRLLCLSGNHHGYGRYVIMDARGQLAAVGNKAMGKGTEIPANYRGAKLVFMNIDNIHAIRQSLNAMTSIFEPRRGAPDESTSLYGKIESSGWLRHVRLVLKASAELALSVHNGVSVLTHCSDGWDRTAQMVSLAELMLDPFYRTLRGFECLIEKEWCSFGHQFAARCGHARSDANNDQRSPVFLLWLDCVWQFIRQFPTECEFNESLLLALADHVFSCKYSTFMFDCDRQRKEFFAKHRAHSMWSGVNSNSERFTSPSFAPTPDAPVLLPSTLSKNIKLWKGYFCRWDPTLIPPVPALQFY